MFQLQGPDEVLDWHQDWTDWMEGDDSITESVWSIEPQGIPNTGSVPTLSNDAISQSGDFTSVSVGGLELGITYRLKNTITTAADRVGTRDIILRCDHQ